MSHTSRFVSSQTRPTLRRSRRLLWCLVALLMFASTAEARDLKKRTPWSKANAAETAKAAQLNAAAEPTPVPAPKAVAAAEPAPAPTPEPVSVVESVPAPTPEPVSVVESAPAPTPEPVSVVESAPAPTPEPVSVVESAPVSDAVSAAPAVPAAEAIPEVSAPPRWEAPKPSGPTGPLAGDFSGQRAYAHLEQLVAMGPRVSGTPGSQEARSYIREQLEAVGAEVIETRSSIQLDPEMEPREIVHLTGVLPGASSDIFMLAAPYDTFPVEDADYVGANEGGSGPALLLEMARALSAHDRGYTVWLSFIDGESIPSLRDPSTASHAGSQDYAASMEADGSLRKLRIGFFFDRVADPDLQIARDLRSHRAYREIVWQAAFDLDHVDVFPPGASFESPDSPHRAFIAERFPRVVALVDDRFGGDQSPGMYARTAEDDLEHTSPESLGTVGEVTLEALSRIELRLAKIDRFVSTRTAEPPAAPAPLD